MILSRINTSGFRKPLLIPKVVFLQKHTPTCPTNVKSESSKCPGSGKLMKSAQAKVIPCPGSGGKASSGSSITRAMYSGKTRLGFLPEEWFLFFHSKTGVSGPYVFLLVVCNYLVSKEKFVMEHEYYSGLSWLVVILFVVKNLGPGIAASLDKEVDSVTAGYEKTRADEMAVYETAIKVAKNAQWSAEGQKYLIDAKKENVAMQLEAIFRERSMHVYRMVRGRMDYHVRRYRAEARIQQKWMIGWILEQVRKSITPEFEKQALDKAIQDLSAINVK